MSWVVANYGICLVLQQHVLRKSCLYFLELFWCLRFKLYFVSILNSFNPIINFHKLQKNLNWNDQQFFANLMFIFLNSSFQNPRNFSLRNLCIYYIFPWYNLWLNLNKICSAPPLSPNPNQQFLSSLLMHHHRLDIFFIKIYHLSIHICSSWFIIWFNSSFSASVIPEYELLNQNFSSIIY